MYKGLKGQREDVRGLEEGNEKTTGDMRLQDNTKRLNDQYEAIGRCKKRGY